MTVLCSWCGHTPHPDGPCPETITTGTLTGHTGLNPLPRRHAGKNGELTTRILCPCINRKRAA